MTTLNQCTFTTQKLNLLLNSSKVDQCKFSSPRICRKDKEKTERGYLKPPCNNRFGKKIEQNAKRVNFYNF